MGSLGQGLNGEQNELDRQWGKAGSGYILQQGFGLACGVIGPEIFVLFYFLLQGQKLAL